MSKLPAYFDQKTLLGGWPDCNVRRIYRASDDKVVWERRPEGKWGWSAEDQQLLNEELVRLYQSDGIQLPEWLSKRVRFH